MSDNTKSRGLVGVPSAVVVPFFVKRVEHRIYEKRKEKREEKKIIPIIRGDAVVFIYAYRALR